MLSTFNDGLMITSLSQRGMFFPARLIALKNNTPPPRSLRSSQQPPLPPSLSPSRFHFASPLLTILSPSLSAAHLLCGRPLIFLPSSLGFASADPIFNSSLPRLHSSLGLLSFICVKWPLYAPACYHSLFSLWFPLFLHPPSILPPLASIHSILLCVCVFVHLSIYLLIHQSILGVFIFNENHLTPSTLSSISIALLLSHLSFYLPLYQIVLTCLHFYHSTPFHLVLWFNLPPYLHSLSSLFSL